MWTLIDRIPMLLLILFAAFMLLAPFKQMCWKN